MEIKSHERKKNYERARCDEVVTSNWIAHDVTRRVRKKLGIGSIRGIGGNWREIRGNIYGHSN